VSRGDRAPSRFVPGISHGVVGVVLRGIRVGELSIETPDGRQHRFTGAAPGPVASMTVRDGSIARRIMMGGANALAEGFMDGSWDTPDLDALLDLGLANLTLGWTAGVPVALRPIDRLWHAMRDNDPRGGSKRNIAHHYDLGNDFYQLWLDDTMTYSAACLLADDRVPLTSEDLARAQRRKWDHVLELIQPTHRDHILELGCGWGGFAVHAAQEAGCRVTGITLSERQADMARVRVREHGLEHLVEVRLQDYREVPETYSGIASIEMFEAVGEKWWPTFFRRVKDLLEPGAAAGFQVITIAEERFEEYRRHPDFTQRYIFPGGMLPSPQRFRAAAQAQDLSVGQARFFGSDYAATLATWADRFEDAMQDVRRLGFDERFIRMWRYYLAYCRAGFQHGTIDVMQVRVET
jgi:cyclopropane-fatty-acyl-phospholipid synthase